MNTNFSKRLNATRREKGFTALAVATELGIELRSYRNYESGNREPSLATLVKLADLLEVSTDYLLCRGEDLSDER